MISELFVNFGDAAQMRDVEDGSVHLVVTSPPYPMIAMWDNLFCRQGAIQKALEQGRGMDAFEQMHRQLDRVWTEIDRVLVTGGIACINIGDATRTVNDEFALYPNHSRVLSAMLALGFTNLPTILWRKQTNAPNKFMGSGMMPPGAYVTLEHEYILVCRKGGKRLFHDATAKANRRRSAYFWEERNQWFSDVWMDLKGTRQQIGDPKLRQRSGAYPFELAYRLIAMFSIMGDTVLDPFLGTGTTLSAAAAAGRNCVGYELDKAFEPTIAQGCKHAVALGRRRIAERLANHLSFVAAREAAGKSFKHTSRTYGFPVITRQEVELMLPPPAAIEALAPNRYRVLYDRPQASFADQPAEPSLGNARQHVATTQLKLFPS